MGRRDLGLAAVVAFAAFALLSALAPAPARLALPRAAALAAARDDPGVAADLRHLGPPTGARVTAIDRGLARVSFYRGARLVVEAAVDRRGHVRADIRHRPGVLPRGSDLAGRPLVVAGLLVAFLLATLRLPLGSLANLDALALAALAAPQLLLAQRLATASVLAAYPPLLYLAAALRHRWGCGPEAPARGRRPPPRRCGERSSPAGRWRCSRGRPPWSWPCSP